MTNVEILNNGDTCRIDYESEYKRLSKIIVKQDEIINALKTACYNLSMVLAQKDVK